MLDPHAPAVALGEAAVPLAALLRRLHQRGRLLPLVREAVLEELIERQTSTTGLTVSSEDLQQAADAFRRRHSLASAEQTHAWLAREHRTVQDFETALERDLLMEKFKDDLTRQRSADHFATHQAGYARARLNLILVHSDGLARELRSQLEEERRHFAELAWKHSQHASRAVGGQLGLVLRRDLPPHVAEAIFAAQPGQVVGPIATAEGFCLFHVEELLPAEEGNSAHARIASPHAMPTTTTSTSGIVCSRRSRTD